MARSRLLIFDGKQKLEIILDDRNKWILGRTDEGLGIVDSKDDIMCSYILSDLPFVSRLHGEFFNINGIWFFMDYGSTNGTFVNCDRLQSEFSGMIKPWMLEDSDVLQISLNPPVSLDKTGNQLWMRYFEA